MFFNKKIKVAVHDGSFHPDDVFAVVILSLYLKKPLKIFRTRDQNIFDVMDYLLDVGREYNPEQGKFDHHQEGWAEKRENGIPYATSGLVWKEFGEKICGSKEVAEIIDKKVIQAIDAEDNGVDIYERKIIGVSPYCAFDLIDSMNPTYKEKDLDVDKIFDIAVTMVKNIFVREIKKAKDYVESLLKMKEIYNKTEDKRIIILDDQYPAQNFFAEYSEPLLVIKPIFDKKGIWYISVVKVKGEKFKSRMDLPESWAGKDGEELQKITGVPDAIFCHNKRFMASAGSREGAIALAQKAIASYN
ncbi:MAG: MYG1 family protein [Candidatus Taylorbacteria bacterium]|nr:MYG1 family protein [Candidatus Taylorbacteria bacterium]